MRDITLSPKREIDTGYWNAIKIIEAKIMAHPMSTGPDPFPLKHSFAEGVYIREIQMPKGYFAVGRLHKDSYLNIILKGDIMMLTEEGYKRVTGPCSIISPPGTKRFGLVLEDTIWITVHANPHNITDIDVLEEMIHDYDNDGPIDLRDIYADRETIMLDLVKNSFDVDKFRNLTKEIYDHEKPGFWSDWTEEQQEIYMSGDWEAFSRSRGYTEEEIDTLREWIEMKEFAEQLGLEPLICISDIVNECVKKNLELDVKGEILKSSHIPSSKKEPYK